MTRIAIVDDDRDFVGLVTDMFSERGWEVIACCDSLAAFALLREEQPDVAILDIRMQSARSGWDILTFLQLHPATHHIPVVVCSAAALDVQDQSVWLREHGIGIVLKPFDLEDLYSAVDTALAQAARLRDARRAATSA
ncbi:MAG TPA: response regulator [Chloroflexota bacterium]